MSGAYCSAVVLGSNATSKAKVAIAMREQTRQLVREVTERAGARHWPRGPRPCR